MLTEAGTSWLSCRTMACAGTFAEEPIFTSTNEGGRFLDVRFERSLQLWPWSGFLALYIRVTQEGSGFQVQHAAPAASLLLSFLGVSILQQAVSRHPGEWALCVMADYKADLRSQDAAVLNVF